MPDTAKQLITMHLGAAGFAQHWKYCDLVANYLATFTSELLNQSEAHSNLVSTVLNELLEVVFRRNNGTGEIGITLTGGDTRLNVAITVPVDDEDRQFYQKMAELTSRSDVAEIHREYVVKHAEGAAGEGASSDEDELILSLLELAAFYDAVLGVKPADDGRGVLLELPFQVEP